MIAFDQDTNGEEEMPEQRKSRKGSVESCDAFVRFDA
jgi:hypothetical protein